LSTGEVTDDDDLLRRNAYDVAFFTYEKFAALVAVHPSMLDRIGVVVFDELHMIEDASRGRTLELLLLRLRRQQKANEWPQLVVLCGELDDLSLFQEWLGLHPVGPGERPVPLVEGVLDPQGTWRACDRVAGDEWTEQIAGFPPPRLWHTTRKPEVLRAEMAVALTKTLLERGERVLLFGLDPRPCASCSAASRH
jgi:superfamily II helicase